MIKKTESFEINNISSVLLLSRRGLLELDLLFSSYIENLYNDADNGERKTFLQLLSIDDQKLFSWFLGSSPVDQKYKNIVDKILNNKKKQSINNKNSQC